MDTRANDSSGSSGGDGKPSFTLDMMQETGFPTESSTDEPAITAAPTSEKTPLFQAHLTGPVQKAERGSGVYNTIRDCLVHVQLRVLGGRMKTFILVASLVLAAVAFGREEEADETKPLYAVFGATEIHIEPSFTTLEVDLRYMDLEPGYLSFYIQDRFGEPFADTYWNLTLKGDSKEHHAERLFSVKSRTSDAHFVVETNATNPIPLELYVLKVSDFVQYEVVFAALILGGVYVLIVFELIHRTLAAMLGSFIALGTLSVLNKRPSLEEIVAWIDFETVMLLFGMMIIVGILSETGIFEYMAVKAYKLSRGNNWKLVTYLCLFSAIVSAFLDNVTTILLLVPVTIRMCNVIGLDPKPVLLAEVLFSNIGGTATAIGDPPNVIIVSSNWDEVEGEKDINFTEFTAHMVVGIVFVTGIGYIMLRFVLFRGVNLSNPDPPEVAEIKREIVVWQKTLNKLGVSQEEDVVKTHLNQKIRDLEAAIDQTLKSTLQSWEASVEQLERDNAIKDWDLLINSGLVLAAVIVMFFIHSIPSIHIDLGWIAVLGAICLLLVSGLSDLEHLLEKVEWGTLLFFASLFILMEALAELGLISWIGDKTADMIKSVPESAQLEVSLILILWISAICSAFIDNIPFTTAMIPVIKSIISDPKIDLPMRPLVWALAFGACLGGNGTLIGASANVVCAGLAEQEGITISFNYFFKFGFPMMLVTTLGAMVYLLICHGALDWA